MRCGSSNSWSGPRACCGTPGLREPILLELTVKPWAHGQPQTLYHSATLPPQPSPHATTTPPPRSLGVAPLPGLQHSAVVAVVGQLSETSPGRVGSLFDTYPCFKCWIWLTMCCGSQDLAAGCHPKACVQLSFFLPNKKSLWIPKRINSRPLSNLACPCIGFKYGICPYIYHNAQINHTIHMDPLGEWDLIHKI